MKKLFLTIVIIGVFGTQAFSQDFAHKDSALVQLKKQDINRRHSIGSSLFLLGNFAKGDCPYFFLLNYEYQLSQKDFIFAEPTTWTYYEPLGTYGSSEKLYPGKIRAYGVGLGYQRFYWRGIYSTVEATPFLQQFYNSDGKKIQKGFQLYLQLILGYRVKLFKKRLFIEPAYAIKYWPVNTNLPVSFSQVESGTPKYTCEPSLLFGFSF